MPFQHQVYKTEKVSVTGAKMCLGEREDKRMGGAGAQERSGEAGP